MFFNPDIFKYIKYVAWRIWIPLALAAIIGGGGYFFAHSQERTFTAEARIFVGNALTSSTPELYQVDVGLRLAPTYAEIARQPSVIDAVIEELDLDMSVGRVRSMVSARVVVDTAILSIRASSNDSELSAAIANSVAENLIQNSPSSLNDDEIAQMNELSDQIIEIQGQIDEVNDQLLTVNDNLNSAIERDNTNRIQELTTQRNLLTTQRNDMQSTVAQLRDQFLTLSNRVGRLEISEYARPPLGSSGFSPSMIGIVGVLMGLGAGVGGLLLYFEYVDSKLRTEKEVEKFMALPVLMNVKRAPLTGFRHSKRILNGNILGMRIAESYRHLKANLLFSPDYQNSGRLYMVVSPEKNDGRTFTAVNQAIIAAEAGLRVLLVDGDLRNPSIHKLFDLSNEVGFAQLLSLAPRDMNRFEEIFRSQLQQKEYPTLDILASGMDSSKVSPSVYGMTNLQSCMEALQAIPDYDIILFDTPSALAYSDAVIFAATTKANVLMVVEHGGTDRDVATKLKTQFQNVGSKVRGVVLNRV